MACHKRAFYVFLLCNGAFIRPSEISLPTFLFDFFPPFFVLRHWLGGKNQKKRFIMNLEYFKYLSTFDNFTQTFLQGIEYLYWMDDKLQVFQSTVL